MTTKNAATAAKIKLNAYYSTAKGNSDEKLAVNLPRRLGVTAQIVKENLSAVMAKDIFNICNANYIFIDGAGFKILQKFCRKFYLMLCDKKTITRKALKNLFDRIFYKDKHCTQTKDAVYFAGDIACDWCLTTSIEIIFDAQENCDNGKEL